ncbi:DUF1015 family protein [Thalassomonas sp. RHCl1]|uniref:DUF1015 family protein n=1 Tax=Thalassomonas sp. RHCl1 TaxID=2995320 RepID=UPI00248B1EB1|nr:DUF1015 family protein [Thalassomonas sp. RHCl1]
MLNTLGYVQNKPFYLYKITTEGREAVGVLLEYAVNQKDSVPLLPHEQINMSHAMKIKKILHRQSAELPPCALIADLDFTALNWQAKSEQIAHWHNEKSDSEHALYVLTCDNSTQLLAAQLAKQESLLIADGHHRAFAASLPHAPLTTFPVWLTSSCIDVDSFSLSVDIQNHVNFDGLKHHLDTFDIKSCDPEEADYVFYYQQQEFGFSYSAANGNSYKIQHQIRTALAKMNGLLNLTPVRKNSVKQEPLIGGQGKALPEEQQTILIRLTAPKITDIISAAKQGHYFPEKSTYFPHKTSAKALALLNA